MSFTKSLRITIPVARCVAMLCLLTLPALAQTSGQEKIVINLENLIEAVEKAKTLKTPITKITKLIKKNGVDFQLTPEIENRIRSAGSGLSKESLDDLVSAVRGNYRSMEDIMAFVKGILSDSKVDYQPVSEKLSQPLVSYRYENVESGQCKISWQENRTFRWNANNRDPDTSQTIRFEINLSDIDPEQITLERFLKEREIWSIIMTTTNSEKKIKSTEYEATTFPNNSEVKFSDKRVAERVSRALKDLVRRCGGKREPY